MQKPKMNHLTSVNGSSSCSSLMSPGSTNSFNNNGAKVTTGNSNSSSSSNGVTTLNCKTFSLPESLEMIQKCEYFPTQRHRWNTNEEIASILIGFDKHGEWLSKEVKIR